MKVLIVYSDINCSCTRKGTFELSRGLKLFTPTDVIHHLELTEDHFIKYNVIMFQRLGGNGVQISENYFRLLEKLTKQYRNKTFTAYFLDDLLINPATSRMIGIVDHVMVPNDSYLKYVNKFNSHIFYTRTFIDLDEVNAISKKELPKDKINILWASTGGVGLSFMQILIPVLQEKIPNALVHIMSSKSYQLKHLKNVLTYPILKYEDFVSYFKSCDVYLNPITFDTRYSETVSNDDFINCKSEIKYLTSAASKIPIISSKSKPYEHAITNNINGIIIDNDIDSWISSILRIHENSELRDSIIENAYKDIEDNYTLRSIGEKVYVLFQSFFKEGYVSTITSQNKKRVDTIDLKNKTIVDLLDIEQVDGTSTVGEIFGNKKIVQSFTCSKNGLFKIDLKFATYMRLNSGSIRVSICETLDGEGAIIIDIPCSSIHDNMWQSFSFRPITDSFNIKYFLKIEGINCRIGSSVTMYYSTTPTIESEDFYINKTKFKGTLTFKTYYVTQ